MTIQITLLKLAKAFNVFLIFFWIVQMRCSDLFFTFLWWVNNLSLDIVVVVVVVVTKVEKCWPALRENHFKISHNLVLNVGHLFSKFLNFCQSHLIDDAYVFYFFAFNWLLLALIEVFETKKRQKHLTSSSLPVTSFNIQNLSEDW